MPKFTVTLAGDAPMFCYVEVEAENKEQAEALAPAKASTDPRDWMHSDEGHIQDPQSIGCMEEPDEPV